ncbi:MAG: citrate synthase [Nitrospirota bacterium]
MVMQDYFPGLAGVPAAKSGVSFVDGQKGILEYRGIPIEELCEKSTFLETSYLLLFDKLPTKAELAQFVADVARHRRIKYRIVDLIKCLPETGHPMDALQAAVAALGMFYPDKEVQSPQVQYLSSVRLIAKLPTIVAAYARLRRGDDIVPPRDDLDHAANFLYMLTGHPPDPVPAKVLDACLILHAEHTMNASTFSGLVTASTLADPYTVVASAIGTLTGPLHGGANEGVIDMIREIGSVDRVRPYMEQTIAAGQRIMGLGHRIYKVKDPRAYVLQHLAQQLFKHLGPSPFYDMVQEIERVGDQLLGHKGVRPNVDFYSGIVYDRLGIPKDCFTAIFAMARVAGWLAHWIEQLKENRLFRPDQIYEGQHDRPYVPVAQR